MAEMGLHSEIADEMKADYSVETESESDSEFLRRFLVPKTHNERKEITENVSKETLTFRAWQQEKVNVSNFHDNFYTEFFRQIIINYGLPMIQF